MNNICLADKSCEDREITQWHILDGYHQTQRFVKIITGKQKKYKRHVTFMMGFYG